VREGGKGALGSMASKIVHSLSSACPSSRESYQWNQESLDSFAEGLGEGWASIGVGGSEFPEMSSLEKDDSDSLLF